MSDFVQTMKGWQRMCNTIKSCDDCPMCKEDGWTYVLCSEGGISSARPEVAEKVIAKWAAEHPEPVYPTWEEWLITQGIIKENPNGVGWPMPKLFERIPADFAHMMGIEPKEG